MLTSLFGFNFSLNSDTCFTAEYFCSSVLLRFDTIPEDWKRFFVLFGSRASSEGSGLSDLTYFSFILGPFGILASESSSGFVSALVLSICIGICSDSVVLLKP